MNNLIKALSEAIKIANEPNPDNFDAVVLDIYDDGTFEIGDRTYSNVTFTQLALLGSERHRYTLTVPKNAYPGWNKWPFQLMEFCAYHAIPISSYEVRDVFGNVRPRAIRTAI